MSLAEIGLHEFFTVSCSCCGEPETHNYPPGRACSLDGKPAWFLFCGHCMQRFICGDTDGERWTLRWGPPF